MKKHLKDETRASLGEEFSDEVWRIVRTGLIVFVVFVLGVGVFLATAPLSGAVIAQGLVKVDDNRKVVQHNQGGIVREIRVQEGDKVKAGDIVLVLEDQRVQASAEVLRSAINAELARRARCEAERAVQTSVVFPPELTSQTANAKTVEVIRQETALFNARRVAYIDQLELLKSQLAAAKVEHSKLSEQIKAQQDALRFASEELNVNQSLVDKNYVSKVRLLNLQQGVANSTARLKELEAELSKSKQREIDTEFRLTQLKDAYIQQAQTELKDSNNRLNELREQLKPSEDASRRLEVRAPVDGVIFNKRVTTAGAFIAPGELLMEVVPAGSKLIIEARVGVEDYTHVSIGADVELRFPAFNARTTDFADGKVTFIAADRTTDPTLGPLAAYYKVNIAVTPEALKKAGDIVLQPGLNAIAYIKTPERTVLHYLAQPVIDSFRRALREPT